LTNLLLFEFLFDILEFISLEQD